MPRPRARMAAGGLNSAPSFVAYYRVSTAQQGRSGLGLDAQRASVAARIAGQAGMLAGEYTEIESGKRSDRPQLALALAACRAKRAILIVAKLDRLARNALFLLTLVEGSGDDGVIFCELPALPPGPIGKFILTVMAAIAELEAGLISERTKAALGEVKKAIERDGGWRSKRSGNWITGLGGPNMKAGHAHVARLGRKTQTLRSQSRAADVMPYIDEIRAALGATVSLRRIAGALTNLGVAPPSGGDRWYPAQVSRAIQRAANGKDGIAAAPAAGATGAIYA